MKKNRIFEDDNQNIWAKEEKKAKELGFENVQAYRTYLSNQNRKKTYIVKIERYKKEIKRMQAFLDSLEECK